MEPQPHQPPVQQAAAEMQEDDNDDEGAPMVPASVDHQALLAQVQAARQAMQQGQPDRAGPLLLRALLAVPALLPELEEELAQALSSYADMLVGQGKVREALWLFEGATRSLPQSKLLWLEQGRVCFRLRQHLRALRSFQRALALDPRFHAALDALESLKSLSVDRWHFRMLNDQPRNQAYRRALQQVVAEEATRLGRPPVVLDIGTGTGLLALLAVKAGAGMVYACETNPVLAKMAQAIVAAAHGGRAKEAIVVLNKASHELRIGKDLPAPVDMIVTELVDSGLLGEHILPVLRHARAALLRPGGRTIPHSARVFVSVIESADVRRRARLLPEAASLLFLPSAASESDPASVVGVDEAYTCEGLRALPHRAMTGVVEVARELSLVDDASARFTSITDLEATDDGQADAVALWFELDLVPPAGLPEEERIAFSTAPGRPQNGWDQALYFLLPTDASSSNSSFRMRSGDVYRLAAAVVDDQLAFQLTAAASGRTVASRGFPAPAPSAVVVGGPSVRVGEADLAQLNDTGRLRAYGEAIRFAVARALSRSGGGGQSARVVEWSGDFSALGLVALRTPGVGAVTVLTGSDESAAALQTWVARATTQPAPVPSAAIQVLRFHAGSDASVVAPALLGLRGGEGQGDAEAAGPLLLVHDLVDGSGLIRQGALQEVLLSRDLLHPQALIPHAFRVVMQCLEAPGLVAQNRLDPANTVGMRLEALDGLGVATFREVDIAAAVREGTCALLSQPWPALAVDLRAVQVGAGGEDEGVLARARVAIPVTGSGTLHALGFWFELLLTDERERGAALSTGPGAAEGREGKDDHARLPSSFRQGAVLLAEARAVQAGQTVHVEIVCSLSRGIDVVLVEPR